ncbi:MAG: aspartate aminotransferase family protein [Solirubrobacteraceae bacterium]
MTLSDLQDLERAYAIPTFARFPVQFVRGEGAWLWDEHGNEHLDFLSGISVTNLGHRHPRVLAAITEQIGQLMHASNFFYTEPTLRLAERLSQSSLEGKVYLCNTGAEANEAAIKLARKARPRGEIVVVYGAFHGRTYGALSATPGESKQAPFVPLVPGFRAVEPTPAAITGAVDGRTAAVMLEPIQGESGVNVLSDHILAAAREACDEHGAALVFDEIQCGMGRTGTLWAYEQTGVRPDAITTAKALGGGLPAGALVVAPHLGDVLHPGEHGSTFAGGPVVAAAALAALDVTDDPGLLARVRELGRRLLSGAVGLPHVLSVRGRGLMLACELDLPAPEVVRRALSEQHLILSTTGPTTVRLMPPLIVSESEIDTGLERLHAVLASTFREPR